MNFSLPKRGPDFVGRAFRCKDGVVRWAYARTKSTGNLHIRWLDEKTGTWYAGGMRHPSTWPAAVDAPAADYQAPQVGDEYLLCGPLGGVTRYRFGEGVIPTLGRSVQKEPLP